MSEFPKTISAPALSPTYGQNVKETFQNIDDNFKVLANRELYKGEPGKNLISVSVPWSSVFETDGSDYVSTITIGDYTINNFASAIITKLRLISNNDDDITATINQLKSNGWSIVVCFSEPELESASTPINIETCIPFVYVDYRFRIGLNETTLIQLADKTDMSCVITCNSTNGWDCTQNFPTLYYDGNDNTLYWNINGQNTKILAQGPKGIDGKNGFVYIGLSDNMKLYPNGAQGGNNGGTLAGNTENVEIEYLLCNLKNDPTDPLYDALSPNSKAHFPFIEIADWVTLNGSDPVTAPILILSANALEPVTIGGQIMGVPYYVATTSINHGQSVVEVSCTVSKYNICYSYMTDLALQQAMKTYLPKNVLRLPNGALGTNEIAGYSIKERTPDNTTKGYCIFVPYNRIMTLAYVDDVEHPEVHSTEDTTNDKFLIVGSVAEGWGTTAGNYAHAEGKSTTASGTQSHAEGSSTTASGTASHAEGYASPPYSEYQQSHIVSSGTGSHAEGYATAGETLESKGYGSHAEGMNTKSYGSGSHAEGYKTEAGASSSSKHYSHAEGQQSKATGTASHAEGSRTAASGENSHAEGYYTTASGEASHAEGYGSSTTQVTASAQGAHAEGKFTTASGQGSHAEGWDTNAKSSGSHAEGYSTEAGSDQGNYAHAEGQYTRATKSGSHAEGYGANATDCIKATGAGAHAEGYTTSGTIEAAGTGAHAEGETTKAYGQGSHAEGYKTEAGTSSSSKHYSHAEGKETKATGTASHTEGQSTIAKGDQSHAEGMNTKAYGQASHTEGQDTIAGFSGETGDIAPTGNTGNQSHAEGYGAKAKGAQSHAEGNQTTATGVSSHTEGSSTTASGTASHAEGNQTQAQGAYAHAEGYASSVGNSIAKGQGSHTEGKDTKAYGEASHAEGSSTTAGAKHATQNLYSGNYAHAEGSGTAAQGEASHAEGYQTTAGNGYGQPARGAHAEGEFTTAQYDGTHAEGYSTTASGGEGAHAEGRDTTASAIATHAEGRNTTASEVGAHAEGYGNYVDSESGLDQTHAGKITASGSGSHAEGYAESTYETDEVGGKITASGSGSHAEGYASANNELKATGQGSHAEGNNTTANGNYSHAEGKGTIAGQNFSSTCAHAEGEKSYAEGGHSHAEGYDTHAKGGTSHAEGYQTHAISDYSHAEGYQTYAGEIQGFNAIGEYAHAEGYKTEAYGQASHAEGKETYAVNVASHAEGRSTKSADDATHAEGYGTVALRFGAHAEGIQTKTHDIPTNIKMHWANGETSGNTQKPVFVYYLLSGANHIFTKPTGMTDSTYYEYIKRSLDGLVCSPGQYSWTDSTHEHNAPITLHYGNMRVITSDPGSSDAIGHYAYTTFGGAGVLYEDTEVTSSNFTPNIVDFKTTISAWESKIIEYPRLANMLNSLRGDSGAHAEGYQTVASGKAAHAEGEYAIASGRAAHAEGFSTTASDDYSHACGKYNAEGFIGTVHFGSTTLYIIGDSSLAGESLSCRVNNTQGTVSFSSTDKVMFSIGIGESGTYRYNALFTDSAGHAYVYDGYFGQQGLASIDTTATNPPLGGSVYRML